MTEVSAKVWTKCDTKCEKKDATEKVKGNLKQQFNVKKVGMT